MPKLIYVYGDDGALLDTLMGSLRAKGYAVEYTDVKDEAQLKNVSADIALTCRAVDAPGNVISKGGLTVNFDTISAVDETGEEIHLTPTEFSLIGFLLKNASRALSREEILKTVWNLRSESGTRVADDTIKRLRKKLANTHLRIETVWGYGFKLQEIVD